MSVTVPPTTETDSARAQALAEMAQRRAREEMARQTAAREARADARTDEQDPASKSRSQPKSATTAPMAGRVVLALSSSMPEPMLREYLRQVSGIPEVIVILRGFIGGARTVAPTGVWVERLRRKDVGCRDCGHFAVEIVVDPLAYRMLGLEQVPAVAFIPGVQDLRHCDAEVLRTSAVAYGAVSVNAALRRLRAEGVAIPATVIQKFRGV